MRNNSCKTEFFVRLRCILRLVRHAGGDVPTPNLRYSKVFPITYIRDMLS